jgi:hypothetical protein
VRHGIGRTVIVGYCVLTASNLNNTNFRVAGRARVGKRERQSIQGGKGMLKNVFFFFSQKNIYFTISILSMDS